MKMKTFIKAALAIMTVFLMENSCDVHEFPNPDLEHKVVLEMDFDRDLPIYTPPVKANDGAPDIKASTNPDDYILRHQLRIYKADDKGKFDMDKIFRKFSFTSADIKNTEETFEFTLPVGNFRFIIWSDHIVEEGKDHFYNTENFEAISFKGDEHIGCNEFKDAFKGTVDYTVRSGVTNVIPVLMDRPFAKYTFISTDLEEFIVKAETLEGIRPGDTKSVNLENYTIEFEYYLYVNTKYNLHKMQTADSKMGVKFRTKLSQLDEQNAELGFDYPFVNDTKGLVYVIVRTYDAAGNKISETNKVKVELMRGQHTLVKDKFLTTMSSGGIGIQPDFDGSFDIPIID